MAHEIFELDAVGLAKTGAWHGLGEVVPEDMDPAAAVARFLGWKVAKQPVYIRLPDGTFKEIQDVKATVRTDHNHPLGVVSDMYQPIQHADMVEDIKALCGEGGAKVHTIGSLRNGQRVWSLLELNETAKIAGDEIKPYLAIMSSHDGSMSYTVAPTAVRIVCNNTFQAALNSAADGAVRIRHTRNAKDAIKQARQVLGDVTASWTGFKETLQKLADKRVSQTFASFVFDKLAPGDSKQAEKAKRLMFQAYQMPRGGITRAVSGTALGIYNAVTEYVDYLAQSREIGGRRSWEVRAESSIMGSGARKRQDALEIIRAVIDDKEGAKIAETGDSETPLLESLLA